MLLAIQYFLVVDPKGHTECLGFGGFHPETVAHHDVFAHLSLLPCHVLELGEPRDSVNSIRISGAAYWLVSSLDASSLSQLRGNLRTIPIVVLVSTPRTYTAVSKFVEETVHPILHFHTESGTAAPRYRELNSDALIEHIRIVAAYLKAEKHQLDPSMAVLLQKARANPTKNASQAKPATFPQHRHAVTAPNETVLHLFGYEPLPAASLVGLDDGPYESAIDRAVELIRKTRAARRGGRDSSIFHTEIDLLLVAPAMQKHYYRRFDFRSLPENDRKPIQKLFSLLKNQSSYGFSLSEVDLREIIESPVASQLMQIRSNEARLVSAMAALRCAQGLIPAIRLPYRTNRIRTALDRLSGCMRGNKSNRKRKAPRLFLDLQRSLRDAVPKKLYEHISRSSGVKIMSDAPLELLPMGDLPLLLQVETSRIPVTPGSLFLNHALGEPQLVVPSDAFYNVLVLRSYPADDPLKCILEEATKVYLGDSPNQIDVCFVDVGTREQFVEAINKSTAPILIFDGHGTHLADDIGTLGVGDGLDVWRLKGELNRIPPIVVLSACDTHPLNGSHATVANGFLALGTRTVLATNSPVDGLEAGRFAARLIFRVAEYLPAILAHVPTLRWSQVLTGLLRMSYITDIVQAALEEGLIDESGYRQISTRANIRISFFRKDWFFSFLEDLSASTGLPVDALKAMLRRLALTQTLRYVPLGNPESIIIGPPEDSVQAAALSSRLSAAEERLVRAQAT